MVGKQEELRLYAKSGLTLVEWLDAKRAGINIYDIRKPKKIKLSKKARLELSRRMINYKRYLRSEEWRKKREQVFNAYGKICSVCGSVNNLHVHHKTYERIGKERISDLQVLCSFHHAEIHKNLKKSKKQ